MPRNSNNIDNKIMNVLIVEDDFTTADYLCESFRQIGHQCRTATNGDEGLFHALMPKYDVIILDIMLPKLDGMAVLKHLREQDIRTPVLLLSSFDELDRKLDGFRDGANDYITKPFAVEELIARAESLVKWRGENDEVTMLQVGELKLDLLSRTVAFHEEQVPLQAKEFQLLECLMRHRGRVVSRAMLLEHVWNYHFDPQTNVIDVHISRLRQKIQRVAQTSMIETIRGAGYRLHNPLTEAPVAPH